MPDDTADTPAADPRVDAASRLHDSTSLFHAFVYFADEAAEEYSAVGLSGRSGYFASRTAAMGALAPEMITATFYNFSPDVIYPTMAGVWDEVTPEDAQLARWRAVARVLDAHVAPVLSAEAIAEATELAAAAVEHLSWAGRPLAAGNAAVLGDLAESELSGNSLVRLWQLVSVLREWRGDAHIGLLVAEPLDGAECTVVSAALSSKIAGAIKATRSWSDADWDAAINRLTARGWVDGEGGITDLGRSQRAAIERRTNELAAAMCDEIGVAGVDRLVELLAPANKALLDANYFAAIGRPAR